MTEVIPAIHPQNLNDIKDKLDKVLGLVKRVQMDINDGKYSDAITWPFIEKNSDDIMHLERGEGKFPYINDFVVEADLLIFHPIEYIPDLLGIGFKSFVIHIDSTDHVKECLETIRNAGSRVGLGIKPSINSDLLEPFITQIDFVQFMGNDKVGHSGVELDKKVLKKIKAFHQIHPSIPIQIDIGVNFDTIPNILEAGVTGLVSTSTIFNAENIKEAIIKLQNAPTK